MEIKELGFREILHTFYVSGLSHLSGLCTFCLRIEIGRTIAKDRHFVASIWSVEPVMLQTESNTVQKRVFVDLNKNEPSFLSEELEARIRPRYFLRTQRILVEPWESITREWRCESLNELSDKIVSFLLEEFEEHDLIKRDIPKAILKIAKVV